MQNMHSLFVKTNTELIITLFQIIFFESNVAADLECTHQSRF